MPDQVPLDLVICSLEVHKAEVQGLVRMLLLVHNVLESKCLMDSAKLWPEACLSWGAQAALLSVAHQALVENVPRDCFRVDFKSSMSNP